ncbi:acyltransferase [uncultured Methylobacterium sp.]|uniref:acyltransferase n=1 Tax=uncultured Methylobacterium sp. TaxID=157278 RepID=UPI002612E8A8|nr:acyltransferase [uncultured Methylobacterium sp.]
MTIVGGLDGNIIEVPEGFMERFDGVIHIEGVGNKLNIGPPGSLNSFVFGLKDGAEIRIGGGLWAHSLTVHASSLGARIDIGENVSINGSLSVTTHEAASISIGSRCLIASGCDISASDFHHVLDAQTGERINPARNVFIGEHVWLGSRVTIMKGARIGKDSVVGTGSIVTGEYADGCLLVGAPARIVRDGITWRF